MSNEGFSYDRYIDLLSGQKTYYQALQYKKQCIPIKLYKYLSVKDYTYDTIEKEEIWASETKVLNDPFEFEMYYADQAEDRIKEFYEDVLERNEVIALTCDYRNKLMWAHYADSHRGLCLEYQVLNSAHVYPVEYVQHRTNITQDVNAWLDRSKYILEHPEDLKPEDDALIAQITKIMVSKGSEWAYEQEYRIVTRDHDSIFNEQFENYKNQDGSIHSTSDLGIELSGIYLGYKFPKKDIDKVRRVVDNINKKRKLSILKESAKDVNDKELKFAEQILQQEERLITISKIIADDNLTLESKLVY